jgi:hypothetical protein
VIRIGETGGLEFIYLKDSYDELGEGIVCVGKGYTIM